MLRYQQLVKNPKGTLHNYYQPELTAEQHIDLLSDKLTDDCDRYSIHLCVIDSVDDEPIGCIRLIIKTANNRLEVEKSFNQVQFDALFPLQKLAEIGRLCLKKQHTKAQQAHMMLYHALFKKTAQLTIHRVVFESDPRLADQFTKLFGKKHPLYTEYVYNRQLKVQLCSIYLHNHQDKKRWTVLSICLLTQLLAHNSWLSKTVKKIVYRHASSL